MPTPGQKSAAEKFLQARCQWLKYSPEKEVCRARSYGNSDLCKEHQGAKKRLDSIIGKIKPKVKAVRGTNYDAVQKLKTWISNASEDALDRFGVQLAQLETLAIERDSGITTVANSYRQLTKDIVERIDKVYGGKNLDIITRMDNLINENAEKRIKQGW